VPPGTASCADKGDTEKSKKKRTPLKIRIHGITILLRAFSVLGRSRRESDVIEMGKESYLTGGDPNHETNPFDVDHRDFSPAPKRGTRENMYQRSRTP
jgi:hypothetical protein